MDIKQIVSQIEWKIANRFSCEKNLSLKDIDSGVPRRPASAYAYDFLLDCLMEVDDFLRNGDFSVKEIYQKALDYAQAMNSQLDMRWVVNYDSAHLRRALLKRIEGCDKREIPEDLK